MGIVGDSFKLITSNSGNLKFAKSTLQLREQLHPLFVKVGDECGAPWQLLEGIAATESAFRVDARNPSSGAAGLMQIMPFHFSRFGWNAESGWNDAEQNIRAGCAILKESGIGKENIKRVLARYSGHVTWLRTGGEPRPDDYVDKALTRGIYFWFLEVGKLVGVGANNGEA